MLFRSYILCMNATTIIAMVLITTAIGVGCISTVATNSAFAGGPPPGLSSTKYKMGKR